LEFTLRQFERLDCRTKKYVVFWASPLFVKVVTVPTCWTSEYGPPFVVDR
jgi:hypothetical protein